MKIKILVSITSKTPNWAKKIKEINKYKIKEAALFLGPLNSKKRQKLYPLLKKSFLKSIPFVHLRNDVTPEEIEFFIKNYKTKVFNTHSHKEFPHLYDWSKYKEIIYLENVYYSLDEKELKKFSGICLDISHLENDRILNKARYKKIVRIIKKFPIGCNHISPLSKPHTIEDIKKGFEPHYFKNLKEFNYIKKYPKNYFSKYLAIETENPIKEQLKAKKYIEKLLKEMR